MPPQSNTYNKDNFRNDIVLLYKGQDQIIERSVASKYAISKSLCICGNMILREQTLNCAPSGGRNEV